MLNEKRDEFQYGFSLSRPFDFAALPKSILPYFRYDDDNRTTETRIDYVQRCFQLLTADFNDDGADEVIVCVDGQVDIYDGATMLNAIKNPENSEYWEYHALIAAPPTYDYGDEPEPGYVSSTSWGYSRSTSQSTTNSSCVKSSLIVGLEQEINAPVVGTKLGGVEFTTKMEQECSKSTSETSTISYSQRYNAEDDDRVVMLTTPYDNYTYEVVASDNVDEIGGILNLSIPQKPATIGLALTDSERYVASDKNTPDLRSVFKHTLGDPFSYPSTGDQIVSNVPDSEILWGNGRWNDFVTTGSGGSTEREIGLDNRRCPFSCSHFPVACYSGY